MMFLPPIGFSRRKAAPQIPPAYFAQASNLLGGGNNSMTISKPTGVVSGDLMISFFFHGSSAGITQPGGWTSDVNNVILGHTVTSDHKVAGGAEPANYTWNFSAGSQTKMGVILAYRPVAVSILSGASSAGQLSAAFNIHAMPSRSATLNDRLVYAYLLDRTGSILGGILTDPPGMAQRFFQNFSAVGSIDLGMAIYDEAILATGATGTRTLTTVNSGINSIGISTSLRAL